MREMLQAELEALERALEILWSQEDMYPGEYHEVDRQIERLQERVLDIQQALEDDTWLEQRFLRGV